MRLTKTALVYAASMAAAATLAVMAAAPASASTASAQAAVASGGTWGDAQRVITPPTSDVGALIGAISCSPAGYCAAIGSYYQKGSDREFLFVVTQTRGRWSKIKVFNLSALPRSDVEPDFVACPSAGNCSVAGYYEDARGDDWPFTVTERNGTWGKALPIPGFSTGIGKSGGFIESMACTSAGNCVAGGVALGHGQDIVLSEKNGVWTHAEFLPGAPSKNVVAGDVNAISCTGDSCLAIGTYTVGTNLVIHQFAAFARNGVWGAAKPIPGLPSDDMNVGPLSCSPGGTCTVLASSDSNGSEFTLTEKNGTWNTRPNDVPGTSQDTFNSMACPSAGNCSADGSYPNPVSESEPQFVVAEHNGTWSKIEPLPGLLRLNHHGKLAHQASIGDVSCGAPGNCVATGWANVNGTASVVHEEALVLNEVGGRWQFAQIFPGIVKLERPGGISESEDVACWSPNHCAAGGFYQMTSIPFVVTER